MSSNTERAAILAFKADYENNSGHMISFDVASIFYDRQLEADSYRDDYTLEEFKADAIAYAEEGRAIAEQEAACKAGVCGHYTCTEGQDLYEWEAREGRG